MRYIIFGDMHGVDLRGISSAIEEFGPDVGICTGDYDWPKTIRESMLLEKRFLGAGKKVIKVPGNHDHAILNGLDIKSPILKKQKVSVRELHTMLKEDRAAYDYLSSIVNSKDLDSNYSMRFPLDYERYGDDFQVMLLHGALEGNFAASLRTPGGPNGLWGRILSDADYKLNSVMMRMNGCNIMLRGHDHKPSYSHMAYPTKLTLHNKVPPGSEYILSDLEWHIINPGALYDGLYATIDTGVSGGELPVLRYHKI